MASKTLELAFKNAKGTRVTISVPEPKDNLAGEEVKAVMDDILAKNIFTSAGGNLVESIEARITTRDTQPVNLV